MKKSIVILWPLTLAAAFFIGYQYQTDSVPASQIEIIAQAEPSPVTSVKIGTTPVTSERILQVSPAKPEKQATVTSTTETIDNLKTLLANISPLNMDIAAIAEAYNLIKELDQSQVIEALWQLSIDGSSDKSAMLMSILLSKYAETAPQAAVEFANDNIHVPVAHITALQSIISTWAKNDPQAAYSWLIDYDDPNSSTSNFPFNSRSVVLMQVFAGLAKQDVYDAVQKLSNMSKDPRQVRMAISGITNTFTSEAEFTNLIDITADQNNKEITQSIITTWTQKSPQQAIDWLAGQPINTELKTLQDRVLSIWVYSRPDEAKQAANWYLSKDNQQTKQQNANKIITTWGRNDPQGTLSWLQQKPDLNNNESIKKLLGRVSYGNTEFAANHIHLLDNDRDKQQISAQIYRSLERSDKQKAAEFLANSPYKKEIEDSNQRIKELREKRKNR